MRRLLAAVAVANLLPITSAHAGVVTNALTYNGLYLNALTYNGLNVRNGLHLNAMSFNGFRPNGLREERNAGMDLEALAAAPLLK